MCWEEETHTNRHVSDCIDGENTGSGWHGREGGWMVKIDFSALYCISVYYIGSKLYIHIHVHVNILIKPETESLVISRITAR